MNKMSIKGDHSKISQEASFNPAAAYVLGGQSHFRKLKITDNPFPRNSKEYDDWEWGWYDAEGYEWYVGGSAEC